MTQEQLEDYVTRLFPEIQKKYIASDVEDELAQRAIIDIYTKHKQLVISSDKAFISLFVSYYRLWQVRKRGIIKRGLQYGDYLHEFMGYVGVSADVKQDDSDKLHNPWNTIHTQALEYIELIGSQWIRKVFYLYYIEGYTITEVADLYNVPHFRVELALKRGIEQIKEWVTEGTENKSIDSL
jgi:predicted DNA-binding protein YlxM (UPF0122 family)